VRLAKLPDGWWRARSDVGWRPRAIVTRRLRRLQAWRAMKATTVTCLFVSNDGRLSVKLLESPVPDHWAEPAAPPGMMHACVVLGIAPVRMWKRTAEGAIPVFEE
jgi:hypothetical protein